jgi:hypothetical protein
MTSISKKTHQTPSEPVRVSKSRLFALAGILLLALAMFACAGSATPATDADEVSTIVAGTMQALTPSAPPVLIQSGTAVSLDGLSFTIPSGIASGAQVELLLASPPAEDMPWWETYPAHRQYPLQGYILPDTFHTPKFYVYPVNEFAQMNEGVGEEINLLRSMIASPGQPLPENLPFLPTFNAGQIFYSNFSTVNFQNGSGIRYLTQYGQAPMPVNNHEMFYTFQGITSDGQTYVSAILPASIPFLVSYPSPEYSVPAEGVPFDWENYTNTQSHFDAVAQKLNASAPEAFSPSLTVLDAFIQSMLVTGTP